MKVALVCIAKNEDCYIEEWVKYHLKLGFDQIFIYENDWRCTFSDEKVTKIAFDGKVMQTKAYNHFITNFSDEYQWAAFFDVDEFLVLKKTNNVKNFISDYEEFNGIGINWHFFGSNNLDKVSDDYKVITRFTKRGSKLNHHIKTILKLNKTFIMDVHNPHGISIVDTEKREIRGPSNRKGTDGIAQLNHYFTKTYTEFLKKVERGRADTKIKREIFEFKNNDLNQVDDYHAFNFMYDITNDSSELK